MQEAIKPDGSLLLTPDIPGLPEGCDAAHYFGVSTKRAMAVGQGNESPFQRATNETGHKDCENYNTIALTNTPQTLWLNHPDIKIRHTSAILDASTEVDRLVTSHEIVGGHAEPMPQSLWPYFWANKHKGESHKIHTIPLDIRCTRRSDTLAERRARITKAIANVPYANLEISRLGGAWEVINGRCPDLFVLPSEYGGPSHH